MPLAYWQNEYYTGDPSIDNQHQQLFEMVNELYDAIQAGGDDKALKASLDRLFDYTLAHFQTEEALMLADHDPNYAQHREKHEQLQIQVFKIRRRFNGNMALLSAEISHFLTAWLIHHMQAEDRPMIELMRQRHLGRNPQELPISLGRQTRKQADWRTADWGAIAH